MPSSFKRVPLVAQELWWRFTHTPQLLLGVGALLALVAVVFVLSHLLGGRIFPNVWALGVNLGGMTVDEAEARLQSIWDRALRISLADGDRTWETVPSALGLAFDARATAESARGVGLSGVPFAYEVLPVVNLVDELAAQNFLLDLSTQANVSPLNPGYRWENDQLVALTAQDGRMLDVGSTMVNLTEAAATVVETRRLDLVMEPLLPETNLGDTYLEAAAALTAQPFQLQGYDPFTDETITWTTDRDTFTSWIEASDSGLDLREAQFRPFLDAQSRTLNETTDGLRFIEPTETIDKMRTAVQQGASSVTVRIRYRATTYTVAAGDTASRISRKTGIPLYLIQQANPNIDFQTATLYVGDVINLPTRDMSIPEDPIVNKRIVVNLNTQRLIAYENGQEVFNWLISSGISTAPTWPGVYQILSHSEVASGSSYTLCSEAGCGQWEMYWFMGIYEVVPGLMNGFHGAVLLPGGQYLGGGSVGSPYTFGCVMSRDDEAELLYRWADRGTVVEIVSNEFQPTSALGQLAVEMTGGIGGA